jgi:predicted Zn-dependent protease
MNLKKLFCIGLTAIFLFSGCTSGKIKPFQGQNKVQADTEGEKRLWSSAQKMDSAIRKSGQIYKDPALQAYLQEITDRLYPDFKGKVCVQLLKDPILNAFALPNGSIYVNIGLIAALENEAQLATVLAHEGIHFTHKHAALQRENFHSSIGVATVVSLLGVPFLGQLVALSSIFGYSQEHEYEAVSLGHQRLIDAGYDTSQSPETFAHLLMESKANKVEEPFFFSTHPALEKRIENFNKLNSTRTSQNGRVNKELYQEKVNPIREHVLHEKIKLGRYSAVIAVLTHDRLKTVYPEHSSFYLGEAYRLRAEQGDLEKALAAYQAAESKQPDFPPVHRALGIAYFKGKENIKAKHHFERYLQLAPQAEDKGFILHYIKTIEQKESAQ